MKPCPAVHIAVLLLSIALAGASVGCGNWLALSNLAAFRAGWLLRYATVSITIQRECYQNGTLVDCATLPEDIGQ